MRARLPWMVEVTVNTATAAATAKTSEQIKANM
jgi:hypothetical protein